jgi:hypothetical protein
MRLISSAENGSVGDDLCFGALTLAAGRVHRAIVPRRSELPGRADVDLLEQAKAFRFAPADEPSFEQVLVLAHGLRREVPRGRILDEFRDCLSYGRRLGRDDTDVAGRFPTANELRGGLPGPQIEAAPHVLATQRR